MVLGLLLLQEMREKKKKTESVLCPVLSFPHSLSPSLSLSSSLSFFIALVNSEILPRASPKSLVVVCRQLRFSEAHVKYGTSSMEGGKAYFIKSTIICTASMSQIIYDTHKLCSITQRAAYIGCCLLRQPTVIVMDPHG